MARNLGGKKNMRLKSLKTRDDMSIMEEDYHTGASASVPFMWESEPGTPKPNFRPNGSRLSPLTPPPSYSPSPSPSPSPPTPQTHNYNNSKPYSSRTNFLNSVFRKLSSVHKPSSLQPLSPGSSSSSSSSSSSTSSSPSSSRRSQKRSSFESRVDEDEDQDQEEENVESPVSTLFFGRGGGGGASDKGCYPKLVKVFTRDSK